MCGVSGIIYHDGKQIPPDLLIRMNRTMAHRGPDEEGYFLNKKNSSDKGIDAPLRYLGNGIAETNVCVGFGHCRLSIINLQSGQQTL